MTIANTNEQVEILTFFATYSLESQLSQLFVTMKTFIRNMTRKIRDYGTLDFQAD